MVVGPQGSSCRVPGCLPPPQGNHAPFEEARAKLQARFEEAGFFQPDGTLHVAQNFVHFITARK